MRKGPKLWLDYGKKEDKVEVVAETDKEENVYQIK